MQQGKFCVIAPKVVDRNQRNWFNTKEEAEAHAGYLLQNQSRGRLMVVECVSVVEPKPNWVSRDPMPADFEW